MDYLFCGIDVSKDSLDYSGCFGASKQILFTSKLDNSVAGISKMIKHVEKQCNGSPIWYCLEHTGNYGLLLAHILQIKNCNYSMISSLDIIRSSGLTRGKSDAIDAQRIAIYSATFSHKLKQTSMHGQTILKMKTLLTIRDQFVRIRTQLKNAYKSLLISSKIIDLKHEVNQHRKEIKRFDTKIDSLEKKILELINHDPDLKQSYTRISKVTGVGLITASAVLIYTNNFKSFENPRKFNCYCGLAPFEYSSGTSVRRQNKTSKYRNKDMKKLLFNAANTAIVHDQQIRTYFNRKTKEGKHKMSVINAVACKIVYRIFAVAAREEPYVQLSV